MRKRLKNVEIGEVKVGRLGGIMGQLGRAQIAVVHTGIGPEAAGRAVEEMGKRSGIRHWIGSGFAGALAPELGIGEVVREEFEGKRRIVSRSMPVETVEEKQALYRETGAAAVDMETETLARCRERGITFTAIRAISDTATQALPVPLAVWYDLRRQRPRPLRLLAWLATHPGRVAPFARFVRGLSAVSEKLAVAIQSHLAGSR